MAASGFALAIAIGGGAALAADPIWSTKVSGVGFGLSLAPAKGDPVLSLACIRGTRQVTVILPQVPPANGDPRLTVSFGTALFPFEVKREALKAGKLVEAAAPTTPLLLEAIAAGGPVKAIYAGKDIGPFPELPSGLAQAFKQACQPLV